MEILSIHAGNTVGHDYHSVIFVKSCKCGIQNAGVGINTHQANVFDAEITQKIIQISSHEAVETFFVIDYVIIILNKTRDHFCLHRTHNVVVIHCAGAIRSQPVSFI